MLKIFAWSVLLFCGGCLLPETGSGRSGADSVIPIAEARAKCRGNMLEVRTAENWRKIRDELQKQTLQLELPGRLARRTGTDGTREEARQSLYLAQMYLQELTAPDTGTARKLLARRSAELLELEFAVLTARILAGEREAAALEDACNADPLAKVPAERLRECRIELETDRMAMRTLLGLPPGAAFLLKPDGEAPPLPPPETRLEAALAARRTGDDMPFSPAELAAAAREYRAGRHGSPVREAFAAALLLLRVPRELYRRELAGQTELVGMRELLTAIGIGAELALAEEGSLTAQQKLEALRLTGGDDPRSRAEKARAEGDLAVARAHIAAALGSGTPDGAKEKTTVPEKLRELLKRLEKYDHE